MGIFKRKKNKSTKSQDGTTFQTRDEFFEGAGTYRKPGYEKKGFYRKVVQVDSNSNNELAVVKLHGKSGKYGKNLPQYRDGKSHFDNYIETKDHHGQPIKEGKHFRRNSVQKNVSKHDVTEIKKSALKGVGKIMRKINRRKLRDLKGRK